MQVRDLAPSEVASARRFLSLHGWKDRVADADSFAKLIANSQRTAVALAEGQIIGFARAITDGVSNGYISMVVVSPSHRRQGIGRALVEHLMQGNRGMTFRNSSVAMERERA
jgi:ribosomal protein S18 acetylase RimI-like enzyme